MATVDNTQQNNVAEPTNNSTESTPVESSQ
ncbi:hypothetical protein CYY_009338, partial [Polysphondylium violaceum]